jgi:SOS-response transcriptional repressor LexA
MTLGERIRQRREALGLTLEQLSERCGVDVGTISALENRKSKRSEYAAQIASGLGLTMEELLSGVAPGVGNTHPATRRVRVPVISWVAAGAWNEAADPYAPGNAARWEDVDEPFDRSAFALEVRGDSMENPSGRASFPEGCLIVVDPARKAKSGDFVVVRNNDWDEATFKQYIVDGGVKLLRPLNAQYPTLQVKPGTVMVGVVVLKIEKQRF